MGSGGAAGGPEAPLGGSGGRPDAAVLYASIVAEGKPGEGPALVSFQNDTKFVMSLWLAEAVFIAVPSGATLGPELAASAAVEAETTTGQHKDNACVQFSISKVIGPSMLEPGRSYSMSVVLDEAIGFVGTLSEGPMVPFVAVRAQVFDRTSDAFRPSRLVLDVRGARETRSVRFATYDEGHTLYQHAGSGELSAAISFVAASGKRYVGTEPVTVGGTPGFTVVVDEAPVDRAAAVVPLNAKAE